MSQIGLLEEHKEYFETIQVEQKPIPDVLEVEVTTSDGSTKTVTVEVIKPVGTKPYIGGYKNKQTGRDYFNSATNTDQFKRDYKEKFHREVQSYQFRTRSSIMKKECGTQMDKIGVVLIDPRKDEIVQPKTYFTSEE